MKLFTLTLPDAPVTEEENLEETGYQPSFTRLSAIATKNVVAVDVEVFVVEKLGRCIAQCPQLEGVVSGIEGGDGLLSRLRSGK